jgi:uncharacterized membrane protein YwaF
MPGKPSLSKVVGWLLLVATIGVASCQGFLADRAEVGQRLPIGSTGGR